jgi:hypothetical protein
MKGSSFSWQWHQPNKDLARALMVRAVFVETTRKKTEAESEQTPRRIQLEPGSEEFLVWILRVCPPSQAAAVLNR